MIQNESTSVLREWPLDERLLWDKLKMQLVLNPQPPESQILKLGVEKSYQAQD